MTEQEWMAATDPKLMLEYLAGKASDRKMRLFAVACCRRIEHILPKVVLAERVGDCLAAVAAAERYADGEASADDLRDASGGVDRLGDGWQPFQRIAEDDPASMSQVAFEAFQKLLEGEWPRLENPDDPGHLTNEAWVEWEAIKVRELAAQSSLLRDIFGNPFRRQLKMKKAWHTATVVTLARQMYESRDFSAMPILADALQDSGCNNEDILNHCRQPGEHCRGCWCVDLLLDKK
jgi:hypothetical protein